MAGETLSVFDDGRRAITVSGSCRLGLTGWGTVYVEMRVGRVGGLR